MPIELRHRTYFAYLDVPADVRKRIGRRVYRQTLQTDSRSEPAQEVAYLEGGIREDGRPLQLADPDQKVAMQQAMIARAEAKRAIVNGTDPTDVTAARGRANRESQALGESISSAWVHERFEVLEEYAFDGTGVFDQVYRVRVRDEDPSETPGEEFWLVVEAKGRRAPAHKPSMGSRASAETGTQVGQGTAPYYDSILEEGIAGRSQDRPDLLSLDSDEPVTALDVALKLYDADPSQVRMVVVSAPIRDALHDEPRDDASNADNYGSIDPIRVREVDLSLSLPVGDNDAFLRALEEAGGQR